jgi:ELWxxDGT repeat protein
MSLRTRTPLSALAAALVLSSVTGPLGADGVAFRVKDIRTVPPEDEVMVDVRTLAPLGATALVAINEEPWMSDGTPAGTRLLVDLAPGYESTQPELVAHTGGRVFFSATTPAQGRELWVTDGTTAGTALLEDIRPGREGSDPMKVGWHVGIVYFSADDGVHGRELWRSDGTPAGTWMIEDVRPGPLGGLDCASQGGIYRNRVYFCADAGQHGPELWRSDGTPNGTFEVADLVPGAGGSAPYWFRPAIGELFFIAEDPEHGRELWATEGNAGNTRLVRDVRPGPADSEIWMMGTLPNRLIFSASDGVHGRELWKSDGTGTGTRIVEDLLPGPETSMAHWGGAAVLGNRVFFVARSAPQGSYFPWVTDGTPAGTQALGSIPTGGGFEVIGVEVLFSGATPEWNDGLWRSDGTPAGTELFALMPQRPYSSEEGFVPVAGGAVFTFCWDDDFRFATCELWATDGTAAGTREVIDFGAPRTHSFPEHVAPRADGIVFGARPNESEYFGHVFRSDGTGAGTYEMSPLVENPQDSIQLPDGEALVAAPGIPGLWRTDGDELSSLPAPMSYGAWLTRVGDEVYFGGWNAASGTELWKTDGTPAGTDRVADLLPGVGDNPHHLTEALDRLWFGLDNGWGFEARLWESRGTAATTFGHPLGFEIDSNEPNSIQVLDPVAGTLVFRAGGGVWALDSVGGEVGPIRTLQTRSYEGFASAVLDGALYFVDAEADGSCALFRSPGTAAQTTRVKSVGCRYDPWYAGTPEEMVAFGGRVYFTGCASATGCELWVSDGTAAGTAPFADLALGAHSSMPALLTPIDGRLYFRGCSPVEGCEPWVTDGSVAGTHRLADIWPGAESGLRWTWERFVPSGRLLYFRADDGTGTELWAMPLEIFYDGFETGNTGRW